PPIYTLFPYTTLFRSLIDGKLNDATWAAAPLASDFIQNFPNVGQPATVKSDVRIVYDNYAIYVGAYLYDDPANIRKQLTARDDEDRKSTRLNSSHVKI